MSNTISVFSTKKTSKTSNIKTPKEFCEPVNEVLLSQAIHVYRDRKHLGLSKVQTRGEVTLTTAKMYRQKGTGNARHGAASAPIFVGGGKAHGPKGVKRVLHLPIKMRRKALLSAWSAKQSLDKVALVADLKGIKSTKDAQVLVDKILNEKEQKNWKKITLFLSDANANLYRFFKNIALVKVEKYSNANAYSVFRGGFIVVDQESLTKEKAPTRKASATQAKQAK